MNTLNALNALNVHTIHHILRFSSLSDLPNVVSSSSVCHKSYLFYIKDLAHLLPTSITTENFWQQAKTTLNIDAKNFLLSNFVNGVYDKSFDACSEFYSWVRFWTKREYSSVLLKKFITIFTRDTSKSMHNRAAKMEDFCLLQLLLDQQKPKRLIYKSNILAYVRKNRIQMIYHIITSIPENLRYKAVNHVCQCISKEEHIEQLKMIVENFHQYLKILSWQTLVSWPENLVDYGFELLDNGKVCLRGNYLGKGLTELILWRTKHFISHIFSKIENSSYFQPLLTRTVYIDARLTEILPWADDNVLIFRAFIAKHNLEWHLVR